MTATAWVDTPVAIQGERVDVRVRELGGGMSAAFVRLAKGTDMAPAFKGLPDDRCQCPHWGFLFKGRLRMRTKDGEEVYQPRRAFYWPPGHAAEALEDCEYLHFSPTEECNAVIERLKAWLD
jgi:ribosomal protein L34